MPYLALDTSAGLAVAVVDDDGAVLARSSDATPRRHAEQLTPHVRTALAAAALAPGDLSALVVGTGPAPFTGLRVGLVTARTLGFALGLPVLGVPSPAAVALRAFDLLDACDTPPHQVVVVTDARRGEVYWARYVRDEQLAVRAVAGPDVAAPGDVDVARAVVAGRGAALVEAAGAGTAPIRAHAADLRALDPDPVALVALALARRTHGEPTPVRPLYLRRPDAVPPAAVAGARP